MEPLTLDDHLQRAPAAADEPAPRDHLVLDLMSGRYFGLGPVGGFVWQRLDGTCSLRALSAAVREAYDVSGAAVEEDLLRFARELLAAGLASRVLR